MASVDWEAAWLELSAYVASRPSHGARDLHTQMATITARCRVSETLLERVLRLYGGELRITAVDPAGPVPPDAHGAAVDAMVSAPPPSTNPPEVPHAPARQPVAVGD